MRINQPYGVRYEYEEFSEEPKKRYFIACEGKKTEYKYFKGIMDNRGEIKRDCESLSVNSKNSRSVIE